MPRLVIRPNRHVAVLTVKGLINYQEPIFGQIKLKNVFGPLPGQFLPNKNTHTDRQIITKRHYDWKYMHMHTIMLLNTCKNLEIYINKS